MKKFLTVFTLLFAFIMSIPAYAEQDETLNNVGFHKRSEISSDIQIKNIFDNYQKYSNSKNLDKFMNLHDDSYTSSDGYGKNRLKELALDSWKEYPDVKYSLKILSLNIDIDNASVIAEERLCGTTSAPVEFVKGNGYIDSSSTTIYYLKKFSNEWRITSDFVINEKTSLRYGMAKYIPMSIDAPSVVSPKEDYTAILKVNIPRPFMALTSINNEVITFPSVKSQEVFRSVKVDGIQERILTSNDGKKNENAIASIGIARPTLNDSTVNVNIVGIAFLSSRVNVIEKKQDNPVTTSVEAKLNTKTESTKK